MKAFMGSPRQGRACMLLSSGGTTAHGMQQGHPPMWHTAALLPHCVVPSKVARRASPHNLREPAARPTHRFIRGVAARGWVSKREGR